MAHSRSADQGGHVAVRPRRRYRSKSTSRRSMGAGAVPAHPGARRSAAGGARMNNLTTLAMPKVINDALALVADPSVPFEDRAAFYGLLVAFKRRIDKALGTYVHKGPTAKSELAAHLATIEGEQLGPLYLGWEPFD